MDTHHNYFPSPINRTKQLSLDSIGRVQERRLYYKRGTIFVKSVDATEYSKTAELLFGLFKEVVEYVGSENVVQIIIDNAANYVAAGRLLTQAYPTMYWNPCVAHCLDLILEDFGKKEPIRSTVQKARELTKFIYNHTLALKLMRKFTDGRELIRRSATCFATNFLTLQSILRHKEGLRAMVTCKEWTDSKLYRGAKGAEITEVVLTTSFWTDCCKICSFSEPLVQLLRIVDSDEKPAMGYVYEGMLRVRDAIKATFKGKKTDYLPWTIIVDDRWNNQLHRPLYAAGYWLNPNFFYNMTTFSTHHEMFGSLLNCIERFYYGEDGPTGIQNKINEEIKIYTEALGDFGRSMAINARDTLLPADWWINYGGQAPYLQKMAVRILSQTASSSGCERNWSVFERIHTKRRNKLEHQRLNDLVYVHYNLRLTQKNMDCKSFDPISLDHIKLVKEWVVDADSDKEVVETKNWYEIDQPSLSQLQPHIPTEQGTNNLFEQHGGHEEDSIPDEIENDED